MTRGAPPKNENVQYTQYLQSVILGAEKVGSSELELNVRGAELRTVIFGVPPVFLGEYSWSDRTG